MIHRNVSYRLVLMGQILPILAGLVTLLGTAIAEPDPGRVDAFGRRINHEDKSIQYIRADPQAASPETKVSPLLPPTQLRAIEAMRTIRNISPDGTLILKNGHKMSLLGCTQAPIDGSILEIKRKALNQELEGKVVRLVFDEETHNADGDMAAYAFLPDGTLLNEVMLREGLYKLDTQATLSSQYALRFEKAAEMGLKARSKAAVKAKAKATPESKAKATALAEALAAAKTKPGTKVKIKNNEVTAAHSPKLPKYHRGLAGIPPGSTATLRTKRTGQDKPSGSTLFSGDRDKPPRSRKPRADPAG